MPKCLSGQPQTAQPHGCAVTRCQCDTYNPIQFLSMCYATSSVIQQGTHRTLQVNRIIENLTSVYKHPVFVNLRQPLNIVSVLYDSQSINQGSRCTITPLLLLLLLLFLLVFVIIFSIITLLLLPLLLSSPSVLSLLLLVAFLLLYFYCGASAHFQSMAYLFFVLQASINISIINQTKLTTSHSGIYLTITTQKMWAGQCIWYSDWLWAGRSGYQILVG